MCSSGVGGCRARERGGNHIAASVNAITAQSGVALRASRDSASLNLPLAQTGPLYIAQAASGCIGYDVGNIVGFLALMHVQRASAFTALG